MYVFFCILFIICITKYGHQLRWAYSPSGMPAVQLRIKFSLSLSLSLCRYESAGRRLMAAMGADSAGTTGNLPRPALTDRTGTNIAFPPGTFQRPNLISEVKVQ